MKTLERCFGVSLAWLNLRLRSGDYVVIHTRSHEMSADIYTKGFVDAKLFHRLKKLMNIFTREELEEGLLNPDPLTGEGKIDEEALGSTSANPQYAIIRLGPSSATTNQKPIKQKAKAKTKPDFSVIKLKPQAIDHASVADVIEMQETASRFTRVDFHSTHFVGSNEDTRCPSWHDVKYRRTYLIDKGKLITSEIMHHDGIATKESLVGPHPDWSSHVRIREAMSELPLLNTYPDSPFRTIDGGRSHSTITFLYAAAPSYTLSSVSEPPMAPGLTVAYVST